MKRLFTVAVAILTVMTLGVTTLFAAGSTTDVVEVTGAKDANGNDVAVEVTDTSIPWLTVEIASSLNGVPANELRILWQKDISAETLPVSLTFNANGTDGQELYVYHWNGSAWELITSGKGSSITATFNSLSPVGLVVRVPADTTSTDKTETSPKTGESYVLPTAIIALVVVASAAYVVATKKA